MSIGPPFEIVSICKGGGYRYCRTNPPHPKRNAKGLYPLHRVLMENKIGRLLSSDEDVHHKDENKQNDDPDNLELKSHSSHARHHAKKVEEVVVKCKCGNEFSLKPYIYRKRKSRSSGELYCSHRCSGKFANQYAK